MTALRAIETHYKGYRFRSRLEARWAVFFDALGLKWEYEPEGFVTAAGPYLPDFRVWTPQGKPMWYEVKPEHVESDEKFVAFEEAQTLGNADGAFRGALLSGDPMVVFPHPPWAMCPRCGSIASDMKPGFSRYTLLVSLYCYSCDLETPCGGDESEDTGVAGHKYRPHKGMVLTGLEFSVATFQAAKKARAARFEHGERG